MNLTEKIKRTIKEINVCDLAIGAVVGLAAGAAIAYKVTGMVDTNRAIHGFMDELENDGLTLYAFDSAQEEHYLQSLS